MDMGWYRGCGRDACCQPQRGEAHPAARTVRVANFVADTTMSAVRWAYRWYPYRALTCVEDRRRGVFQVGERRLSGRLGRAWWPASGWSERIVSVRTGGLGRGRGRVRAYPWGFALL
jgi:hypothetical protein